MGFQDTFAYVTNKVCEMTHKLQTAFIEKEK